MATNKRMYRCGVDVGGTNTDCVILDARGSDSNPARDIRSAFKTPTTPDVTTGITAAIRGALHSAHDPAVAPDSISAVMLGTTHFINAIVQADARALRPVAVLRLCGPYTRENPPFLDFPPALARIINSPGHVAFLPGGMEFDTRDIAPLDEAAVRAECAAIRAKGIADVAITAVFSPLDVAGRHEERARHIVLDELARAGVDVDVVVSRDVGHMGFLERENAAILNAAILKFARATVRGFRRAMVPLGLGRCPLFLTQNDGTVIDAALAERCPVRTFNSGPTNSMAGAAYLAGLLRPADGGSASPAREEVNVDEARHKQRQVIVADVGGTTTDVCALLPSGFPREAGTWVEIGGVRSAFPMPQVLSIALGGGTRVYVDDDDDDDGRGLARRRVKVGPGSVGHRLTEEALVFGGEVLTATDVVVAANADIDSIGDRARVAETRVAADVVAEARREIKRLLEKAVDAMKLSADDALLIMVGGGSIIHAGLGSLKGVGEVVRPPYFDCANAVGAALARVSGQVDVVRVLEGLDEEQVVAEVCDEAKKRAVAAGADAAQVRVTEVESLPLQYVQLRAARIVAKAVGPLAQDALLLNDATAALGIGDPADGPSDGDEAVVAHGGRGPTTASADQKRTDFVVSPSAVIDVRKYAPTVDDTGVWWVSEVDCEFLALGASVLACGGGGPGHLCYMAARAAIQAGRRLCIVDIASLPDDGYILGNISYGAPTVTLERTPSGTEGIDATEAMLDMFPAARARNAGQIAIEIGGMNAIRPLLTGLHYGVPAVDGDFMCRAYPRGYMLTPYLYGFSGVPCTQADGNGNVVTVNRAADLRRVEKIHRKAGYELGLFSQMVIPPMTVALCKKVACLRTTSLAWRIGRAVYVARQDKTDIMQAIVGANPSSRVLYRGKIVSIVRYVSDAGYTEGKVRLRALSSDEQEHGEARSPETRDMVLPFQNEYLYAELVAPGQPDRGSAGDILCTVPDLISLCGTDGYALGTQDLRYGVRVSVVAMVAHPHWYTPQGIATGGPREFGLDMDFKPLGPRYHEPASVVEEYQTRRGCEMLPPR